MWLRQMKAYLFPGAAEAEEGFRLQILKLSLFGLKVAAGVTLGVTLLLTLGRLLFASEPAMLRARMTESILVGGISLLAYVITRLPAARFRARGIAMVLALLLTGVLVFYSISVSLYVPTMEDYIPAQVTLILLVMVASLPLRPMHAMTVGLSMCVMYVVESTAIQQIMALGSGPITINVLFILLLTVLATGLSAILYRQRYLNYEAYVRSLQAAEELRRVETRMLITDHAASIGKLAAALAHELNSPIGALRSAVDTLILVTARMATRGPEEQERLVRLQADLRKSIKESSDRLSELVARTQRFSNLDKAEVMEADINELLSDAAAMAKSQTQGKMKVELDLKPLPPLLCRPTQLSAVFHGLLSNAANASQNGTGYIHIASHSSPESVEVLIDDRGRGMTKEELAALFEPQLQVSGTRIASGNWSMFSFRRIIREHGGEITVESKEGQGTRVRITLPCEACLQESTV